MAAMVAAALMAGAGLSPAIAAETDGAPIEDAVVLDYATGKPVPAGPSMFAASEGFWTLSGIRNNVGTYTLKLVESPNVEMYRPYVQAVVDRINALGVANLTVAAGVLPASERAGVAVPSGEIDVQTTTLPACPNVPSSIGCTTTWSSTRAGGGRIAVSARVSLDDSVAGYTDAGRANLVFHEMGHALGLDHFDSAFEGTTQVMRSYASPVATYQSGDINGLRYLAFNEPPRGKIEKATGNQDGSITVAGWALDPDFWTGYANVLIDGVSAGRIQNANRVERSDVYPTSGWYGFDDWNMKAKPGPHTVCLTVDDYPSTTHVEQVDCVNATVPGDVPPPPVKGFTQIAAGFLNSAALNESGKLYAWGRNYGPDPQPVPDIGVTFTQVATNEASDDSLYRTHFLALSSTGDVYAWGNNQFGQSGSSPYPYSPTPEKVEGFNGKKLTGIAVSAHTSAAIAEDGTVYTWGSNENGALGTGTTATFTNTPKPVTGITGAYALAGGGRSNFLTATSKGVYSWGDNSEGILGHGISGADSPTPGRITALDDIGTRITQVATSSHDSMAVGDNGKVWSWGHTPKRESPTVGLLATLAGHDIAKVAVGSEHVLALTRDGSLLAYGQNGTGQLGDGTQTSRTEPLGIAAFPGKVKDIAAATSESLVLLPDNTIYQFGWATKASPDTSYLILTPKQLPYTG